MSSNKNSKLLDIEVSLIKETELAFLLKSIETKKTSWVPKSLTELTEETAGKVIYDNNLNVITKYTCTIPTWLAQRAGFL